MANHHPPPDLTGVKAVTEAGYRGDTEFVTSALDDPDPLMRRAALGAAHRLGLLDAPTFRRFLCDQEATVRRRAVELAARHRWEPTPPDDIVSLLIERCDDEWRVAEMSAFALGELGVINDSVEQTLSAMTLEHTDALCREAAVAALGCLGIGRATILAALDDRAAVRRRAVIALAPFDGPDVDAALRQALQDRDWQVRQAAEDLLTPPAD